MGVGAGLYVYDVVVKSSRLLSQLLMSFLYTMTRLFPSSLGLNDRCRSGDVMHLHVTCQFVSALNST